MIIIIPIVVGIGIITWLSKKLKKKPKKDYIDAKFRIK